MKVEKDILKKHISSDFKKEVPSVNFTNLVMQKVEQSLETKTEFAPLISKKTWRIVLIVGAVIILSSFGIEIQTASNSWFSDLGFKVPNFSQFKTTITLSIGIITILGLMTVADMLYRSRRLVS